VSESEFTAMLARAGEGQAEGRRRGRALSAAELMRAASASMEGGMRAEDWDSIAEALLMLREALGMISPA
jgi:hypothetical protein